MRTAVRLALALGLTRATAARACGAPPFPPAGDALAVLFALVAIPVGFAVLPGLALRGAAQRPPTERSTRGRLAAAGLALLWPLTAAGYEFWGIATYALAVLAYVYLMVPLLARQPRVRVLVTGLGMTWALHVVDVLPVSGGLLWNLTAIAHLGAAAGRWGQGDVRALS